ncbi:MAG: STAS domain-containing protein [Candidatus Magnetobacterium sp. LHC-1]|nr:STAS domain-containing protein [Nitrospirota bacterium]
MLYISYNENEDGSGVLSLTGELIIANAEDVKGALLSALSSARCLQLDVSRVTEVDLSYIQLLCSAHRFAGKRQGQLSFTPQPSELFKEIVRASGVVRHKVFGR